MHEWLETAVFVLHIISCVKEIPLRPLFILRSYEPRSFESKLWKRCTKKLYSAPQDLPPLLCIIAPAPRSGQSCARRVWRVWQCSYRRVRLFLAPLLCWAVTFIPTPLPPKVLQSSANTTLYAFVPHLCSTSCLGHGHGYDCHGQFALALACSGARQCFLYEEFTRLAESRLAQNKFNYLKIVWNRLVFNVC